MMWGDLPGAFDEGGITTALLGPDGSAGRNPGPSGVAAAGGDLGGS